VKKSPTGGKGVVQCSFKNGLPGRGTYMYIISSLNNTYYSVGNFDIKEVLKSVYFFS